jgi:hypothetical protein
VKVLHKLSSLVGPAQEELALPHAWVRARAVEVWVWEKALGVEVSGVKGTCLRKQQVIATFATASYGSIKEIPMSYIDHERICGRDAYTVGIVIWVGQWLACAHNRSNLRSKVSLYGWVTLNRVLFVGRSSLDGDLRVLASYHCSLYNQTDFSLTDRHS